MAGFSKYNAVMHLPIFLLAVFGVAASASAQNPWPSIGPGAGAPDGSRLVAMSLMSDHTSVQPGQSLMLAVRYQIEDDWHLYWRNPGETGLPPAVKFEAPAWLTIGQAMWPAPLRHEMPGPLVDFIYEKEVVLLFPAEVAADAPLGDQADIKATSDWLVCRRECLLGEGGASVTLTVVDSIPQRSPASSTIQQWRDKLPRKLDEMRDPPVQAFWRAGTLVIEAPGAQEIVFFPYQLEKDDDAMPRDILKDGLADADRLEVSYDSARLRKAVSVRGVVTIKRGKNTSSWELELEVEQAEHNPPD